MFHISNGAVVFSNGGVELAQATNFTNQGTLTVTKNSTFPSPGNFELNAASSVSGDGIYRIEQDWINDAQFNAGNGSVELYGNTAQRIISNNGTVTTFNGLSLTGTGTGNDRRKILVGVDAGIGPNGFLAINDRELATETQTFFVLNPSVNAVTNDVTFGGEGFVSSLGPAGYFSRVTNASAPYLFPTGSSVGTLRYRPVTITPQSGAQAAYNARLNNHDATPDGYDRSNLADDVCSVNGLYYHSIIRSMGGNAADIAIHFLPAADGNWEHLSRWQTSNARWNSLAPVTAGAAAGFNVLTKTAWNFPDAAHPYALSTGRPLPPVISVCPSLCMNAVGQFSATGSSTGYQWSVPNGNTIESGQGTANISVQWTTGTGYVTVIAVGPGGCHSLPDSCLPEVFATPVADFTYQSVGPYSPIYQFMDGSTWGAEWHWEFGDGETSLLTSPQHEYASPGTYEVLLTVTTKEGCSSQTSGIITVETDEVFIPNTFTPNDDNLNDGFRPVNRSGEAVSFSIYNRWGEMIYASSHVLDAWDGTYGGRPCPLGVYVCKVFYKDPKGSAKTYIGRVNLIK